MTKKTFQIFDSRAQLDGDTGTLEGYASVFDKPSELMFGVREYIAPGAFDGTDMTDVRALFNHDPNQMLGRTTSGTLEVGVDDNGLWYKVKLPDTQTAADLAELIKRGDITQSSFGFTIADAAWEVKDGEDVYVIKKIERLFDVSPVTFPAYPQTSVQARSVQAFFDSLAKQKPKPEKEKWRRAWAERHLTLITKIST